MVSLKTHHCICWYQAALCHLRTSSKDSYSSWACGQAEWHCEILSQNKTIQSPFVCRVHTKHRKVHVSNSVGKQYGGWTDLCDELNLGGKKKKDQAVPESCFFLLLPQASKWNMETLFLQMWISKGSRLQLTSCMEILESNGLCVDIDEVLPRHVGRVGMHMQWSISTCWYCLSCS